MQEQGKLGRDLPDFEEQLFELEQFPLLDIACATENMNSEALVHEVLQIMVNQEIPNIIDTLQKSYAENNWANIEKLAHKMKGGAVYSGTIRMKYACQYMERYQKAGHTKLLDKLYQQLIQVIEETKQTVEKWLSTKKS